MKKSQSGEQRCPECDRRFASLQAVAVHRYRSHGVRSATKHPQTDVPVNVAEISELHKARMKRGKAIHGLVRDYLSLISAPGPGPGRVRTKETIDKHLAILEDKLADRELDPVRRLKLVQQRLDLLGELDYLERDDKLAIAENQFCEVALIFAEEQGISYEAWRAIGVPPKVLKQAGITR